MRVVTCGFSKKSGCNGCNQQIDNGYLIHSYLLIIDEYEGTSHFLATATSAKPENQRGTDQGVGIVNVIRRLTHAARQILQVHLVHDAKTRRHHAGDDERDLFAAVSGVAPVGGPGG